MTESCQSALENGMESGLCVRNTEKYRATQLWNDVIRAFRSDLPLKKHRYKLKIIDQSFTATEAIDWLSSYLARKNQFQQVSREKSLLLLEKFYSQGLFEPAKGEKLPRIKDDNVTVYRFCNISPSKIARTPLALKQHQQMEVKRKLCESPSILKSRKFGSTPSKMATKPILNTQPQIDEQTRTDKQSLPELQLVTRTLTPMEVENTWKILTFTRLKTLMNLEKFDFFDIQNFDGAIIVHNANMFSPKGVCRVQDKADDIPKATMQAMKCLANWPWYNSAINWPIYLGFERDVFRTVVEYFKQESPLVIEQLQQLFLSVIKINEEKKTDFLVTGPVEFSSQKSLETLVKEMKVGSPRAERLVATGNLNNKSDFKLTKKEFHVETEFGVDSPVTRLIVPKSELHWQQDHDNKTPIRTPTATGIQTKFGQPKSPLSMYFTKRKDLEISPQGEKTTVVSKLNINVTTDKFVVLNSPIDETHAAMDQLSYSESLERTLDSLPGLVKSPELLSKVDQFKRPMESNKTRATIVGSERPRFFRNLPGSRASIATSNAHRNPVDFASGYKPSRIPVRILNEPGSRHSLAVTKNESQPVHIPIPAGANRTFNHNAAGSRFSVASIWSGDLSASVPNPISFSSGNSNVGGNAALVESLQICCLLMPPKHRRHLQLLLRMMSKVAVNYCLKLDVQRTNRAVVLETFTDCLVSQQVDREALKQLVKALLDNHAQIFAPPDSLKKLVNERIGEIKRSKVSYVYERPTNLQFCNRISESEFENERVSESQAALLQLLNAIVEDENLKPTDRKRQLKNFKKAYPDLYRIRFPTDVVVPQKLTTSSRLAASFEKLRSLR